MGLGSRGSGGLSGYSRIGVLFVLVLIAGAAVPALAAVYDYGYASQTGTVRGPSASLQGGISGSSAVSSVASDAATVTVDAGLVFYENAGLATTTTPSVVTSLTAPAGTGSTTVARGNTRYLYSPQFTTAATLYSGTWVLDLWMSASKTGYTMNVAVDTVNSAGTVVSSIIASTATPNIATGTTEYAMPLAGAAGSIPANGYIRITIDNPTGAGRPSLTVSWGAGQLTNFKTPSNYDYVLTINNGAAVTWSVTMGVASSSNIGRLSNFTVSFATAPVSQQVIITGGAVSQGSGTSQTLPASSTLNIAVGGTANALPTGTNTPSIVTVSLKVLSSSSTAFAQYTIVLTIN